MHWTVLKLCAFIVFVVFPFVKKSKVKQFRLVVEGHCQGYLMESMIQTVILSNAKYCVTLIISHRLIVAICNMAVPYWHRAIAIQYLKFTLVVVSIARIISGRA